MVFDVLRAYTATISYLFYTNRVPEQLYFGH